MSAEMLRASILQKALVGKLVPQLDEEPEVNQVGDAPEEAPFEIPEKWKWAQLSALGALFSGKTPKAEELTSSGNIPYFKVADMNAPENQKYMRHIERYLKATPKKVFKAGSIIFPKNGGAVFTNKRRLLVCDSIVDLNTGGFFPNKALLDGDFAFLLLSSIDFRKISKGTALPTIDSNKLRSYPIPLPPLEEQKRIVEKIEELLPLIEEYGRDQERLKNINKDFPVQMEKSLLQEAISGKLVPQRDDEPEVEQLGESPEEVPFEIPGKWKWIQIKNLVSKAPQKVPNKKFEYVDVASIDTDHLTISSTKILEAKEAPSRARKVLLPGMVIYSTVRPYLLKACVIGEEFKNRELIGSTAFASMSCEKEVLLNRYLLYYLIGPFFTSHVKNVQKGVAYPAISEKDFFSSFIPLPPLAEQKRIVEKLDKLMLEIQKLK